MVIGWISVRLGNPFPNDVISRVIGVNLFSSSMTDFHEWFLQQKTVLRFDPIDASAKVFPNQPQQIKFLVEPLSDKRNMPFPLGEPWQAPELQPCLGLR